MALNCCKFVCKRAMQAPVSRIGKAMAKIPTRTLSSSKTMRDTYDEQRTTVTVLNQAEGASLMVDSYSQIGFRLNNDIFVMGPMAIFPKSVFSWNVGKVEDVNQESLSLFYTLDPKIDILVIGVGDRGGRVDPAVIQFMRSKKINLEILPTEQACSTFNFLNSENRYVAAAMIPPATIRANEHYIELEKLKSRKLFLGED